MPEETPEADNRESVPTLIESRASNEPLPAPRPHIDYGELAKELAPAMRDLTNGGGVSAKTWATLIGAVLTIASAVGVGNWQVMSEGDDQTQRIIREELQTYGEKMEVKVEGDIDDLRAEFKDSNNAKMERLERIETAVNRTRTDIEVLKAKIDDDGRRRRRRDD